MKDKVGKSSWQVIIAEQDNKRFGKELKVSEGKANLLDNLVESFLDLFCLFNLKKMLQSLKAIPSKQESFPVSFLCILHSVYSIHFI